MAASPSPVRLSSSASSFLSVLELLEYGVEPVEPLGPRLFELPHPVVDRLERRAVEPVEPPPPVVARLHGADLAQHLKVLRHRRRRQGEAVRQLTDRALALRE